MVRIMDRKYQIYSGIHRVLAFLICVLMLSFSCFVYADNQVNIKSEQLIIKRASNKAIFSGDVIVRFHEFKLHTDSIIVYYENSSSEESDAIERIREIKIPGRLKVVNDCAEEISLAGRARFDNRSKKLTLEKDVVMLKEGKLLKTDKLVYLAKLKEESDAK